jgi:preprotein translocase subunit SecY
MFNMFSGGALQQLSIFALGIMPYVSASIVIQLLTVVIPKLDQLNKEGEQGRRKINQLTRYGTILLAAVQGYFIAQFLEGLSTRGSEVVVSGWGFRMTGLSRPRAPRSWLVSGSPAGVGWQLVIIFAGIVAAARRADQYLARSAVPASAASCCCCWSARSRDLLLSARRIPVQYAKRQVGRKLYQGAQSFLPLKINMSGVIPPIFASSILMFPTQIASMSGSLFLQDVASVLHPADWRYNTIYTLLVIFFAYFYTAVQFNPVEVADNLKKGGGFIPGIRPGKNTAEYIERVLTRITFAGAMYLSVVCMIPALLQKYMSVPFQFGGTGLLIVVGVALDTVQQIESYLITRNYEGFTGPKGPRIRGRTAARPAR